MLEGNNHNFNHYEIVLRPGCTPEQLKAEADQRLKPLEMEAEVKTMEEFLNEENRSIQNTRKMVYAICLFVLFWVFAGLFWIFSKLNALYYFSPSEWKLWSLFNELDEYWESVDVNEYNRREQAAEKRFKESRKK